MYAQVTLVGNLVKDPELRFTQAGVAVCNFTLACTKRHYDKDTKAWVDGDTVFMNITAWHQMAENIADTLSKGKQALVIGELVQRSFEDKTGATKTVYEVKADHVGPSMRYMNAKLASTSPNAHPSTNIDPWAIDTQADEAPF